MCNLQQPLRRNKLNLQVINFLANDFQLHRSGANTLDCLNRKTQTLTYQYFWLPNELKLAIVADLLHRRSHILFKMHGLNSHDQSFLHGSQQKNTSQASMVLHKGIPDYLPNVDELAQVPRSLSRLALSSVKILGNFRSKLSGFFTTALGSSFVILNSWDMHNIGRSRLKCLLAHEPTFQIFIAGSLSEVKLDLAPDGRLNANPDTGSTTELLRWAILSTMVLALGKVHRHGPTSLIFGLRKVCLLTSQCSNTSWWILVFSMILN